MNLRMQVGYFTVDEVAEILECSVDHVRRIPKHLLPCSKPGKSNIYRFQDIDNYVISKRVNQHPVANDNQSLSMISSIIDGVRGAKSSKGLHHV